MTTTKDRSKTIAEWCALFPGTTVELADKMRITRMALWNLRSGGHRKCPFALLRKLAAALKKPADGSTAPTFADLVQAWKVQHED